MQDRRRSLESSIGAALLALLVVVLPIARGGVEPWARAVAAVVAPVALALLSRRDEGLPWLAAPLAAVTLWIGLQALPLPPSLHGTSPGARAIFELSLGPLGLYPAPRALSLDPMATLEELALSAAGLAAFASAWAAGSGRRARRLVARGLAASGVLVSLSLLGLALFDRTSLFAPSAPFVNPNHLAGFANLAAFTTLGLALREQGSARLAGLVAFAVTSLPVFLSLSRGGLAAYVAGAGLYAVLSRQRESAGQVEGRTAPRRRTDVALGATLMVVLAGAGWFAARPLAAKLEARGAVAGEEKTALWPLGAAMIADFPLTGVGRGAFETAFPAYKTDLHQVTYTHLENEWLQAPVDLGLPVGLLLIGALGLAWLLGALRSDGRPVDAGLLAGTAAVALQNAVDFSLRLPGVAVPFMVALGLVARGGWRMASPRAAALGLAGVLLAAGAAGSAISWRWTAARDEVRLAQAGDLGVALASAREVADRRPADFLPHAVAGVRLVEAGRCSEAMPWLSRAMLLGPTSPESHLYAARCLAAAGQKGVARREYRLAAAFGSAEALPEALRRFTDLEDLFQVAPDTPDGLGALGNLLAPSRPADAAAAYRRAIDEFQDRRAAAQLAQQLLRVDRAEEALSVARARSSEAPAEVLAWRVAGEALLKLERIEEAEEELRRGLAANPGAPSLLQVLGDQALRSRRFSEARRLAEQMVARTPLERYEREMLLARALGGQERFREAIEAARSAAQSRPDAWPALDAIATFSEKLGRYDDAATALETALSLGLMPAERLTPRIAALREAQLAREVRRAAGEAPARP